MTVTIASLEAGERAAADPPDDPLAGFTFPAYRHLLALRPLPRHPNLGETEPVQPFAFVARDGERVVALALAERPLDAAGGPGAETAGRPTETTAHLLSVLVQPEYRQRGLAGLLVAAVERSAREHSCHELVGVYSTGRPAIAWLERLLARRGWDPPERASVSVRLTAKTALTSPAFEPRLLRALQRGITIVPWSEISEAEHAGIRRSDAERCWIEPSLAPWQYHPRELDWSSLGVRAGGGVVGWVLCHRLIPDTVRVSVAYMRPDLARRGKTFALYHALAARLESTVPGQKMSLVTPHNYPLMLRFIERWLTPLSEYVEETRRARIGLR